MLDILFIYLYIFYAIISRSKMYSFIIINVNKAFIHWKQVSALQTAAVCLIWNTLSFYVTAPFRRYESAEHHSRPARFHESRWRHYLCLIRWFMTNEIYSTFDQCLSAKLHISHDFVVVVFSTAAKLIARVESTFLSHELINCF